MSSVEHISATSHTPKLRASCDPCAISKVKCSKERPVCSRCAKRGASCKYLATKRQQSDRNAAAASESPRHTGMQRDPASLSNASPPNTPLSFDDMIAIDAFNTTTISTPPYPNIDLDNFLTDFVTDSLSSHDDVQAQMAQTTGYETDNLLSSSNDDTIFLFAPKSSFPVVDDIMVDVPALSRQSTPPRSHTPSLFGEHRLDSSLSDPSCCCLYTALSFVERLSPKSAMACSRSADTGIETETSRPLTIESVVEQNGQVIDSIRSILQCPCSRDGYVLTTISLVVLKIIGWYTAVARGLSTLSADSRSLEVSQADSVHQIRPRLTSTHSKHILFFPATVGSYCIDGGKDSHRMAAQLVLSELHRVQGLVNLFSQRLKHNGDETPGSPSNAESSLKGDDLHLQIGKGLDSPFSPSILDQLEENLRRRLRAVWRELVDILQRG